MFPGLHFLPVGAASVVDDSGPSACDVDWPKIAAASGGTFTEL